MPIPNVVGALNQAWAEAEQATLLALETDHWDSDEEFITSLFRGELRSSIRGLSDRGDVWRAFLEDLCGQFPNLRSDTELLDLALDVSATTTFHPREAEGASTGGDFGIVLERPSVKSCLGAATLKIEEVYARGVLCQAKLSQRASERKKRKWGHLTKTQKRLLPRATDFLALLLYNYTDSKRRSMKPFEWQICRDATVDEVEHWLRDDSFPDVQGSSDILVGLGDCSMGTADSALIKEFVAPKVRDSLIIRVGWPPDHPPPSLLEVERNQVELQRQVLRR